MTRTIRAPKRFGALSLVAILLTAFLPTAALAADGDVRVTAGSPPTPFSRNKQNEPALAVDAHDPDVLVAGANDEIDMEACNAGDPTTCPFTAGVGVSGVYFSFDRGATWTQPTYQGWTARHCLGPAACEPRVGPIGTLPWYHKEDLVSDGDPAVAFGPQPAADGSFSWSNGSRLYFANLTSNFEATGSEQAFKGFEAIAVSRTDDVRAAARGDADAWQDPVIVSRQSATTFSDKEQIWADNASSSRFFGTVYLCWASFRGRDKGSAVPAPLIVANSHDGGTTWSQYQITAAANNVQRDQLEGCTVRTDSTGTAYVFGVGTSSDQGHQAFELMSRSTDGGRKWSRPDDVGVPVTQPGVLDPVQGRPVIDGVAGARSDLAPAPNVDIANGAPDGAGATNRIVMTYVSGGIAAPHVYFTESTDLGEHWAAPRAIERPGDRGFYAAPAISPDGTDVYVVYNAFTTPYRGNTTAPRSLAGVFLHADSSTDRRTATGAFTEVHRGAPGDPRGSSANALNDEFLGDYVYAVATRDYGSAVWNDTRDAADCPAIDAWRISLQIGTTVARPAPARDCSPSFGNSDIYGVTVTDPTP